MSTAYQIVVCGSIVPDPLQTLEPVTGPTGPALKNEMMLPAVLDPWASHALYEAANLAKNAPGSKVWLVSLGPKAKLQQVMMTVAQKVPFELIALDGPASGFTEAAEVAAALAEAIQGIPGLDRSQAAGVRRLGIRLPRRGRHDADGRRTARHPGPVPGRGRTQGRTPTARWKSWSASKAASTRSRAAPAPLPCSAGPPAICPSPRTTRRWAWSTCAPSCPPSRRPSRPSSPAKASTFASVSLPKQLRETKIVKDKSRRRHRARNRRVDQDSNP